MLPPALMLQYSKRPSKTGQSSPTLNLACSLTKLSMLSGVTRWRNSTYSSVWNCDISRFVAGFARCVRVGTTTTAETMLWKGGRETWGRRWNECEPGMGLEVTLARVELDEASDSRRSPCACRARSSSRGCGTCGCASASSGVRAHSGSSRYRCRRSSTRGTACRASSRSRPTPAGAGRRPAAAAAGAA